MSKVLEVNLNVILLIIGNLAFVDSDRGWVIGESNLAFQGWLFDLRYY